MFLPRIEVMRNECIAIQRSDAYVPGPGWPGHIMVYVGSCDLLKNARS